MYYTGRIIKALVFGVGAREKEDDVVGTPPSPELRGGLRDRYIVAHQSLIDSGSH
jgi:hypothetical protein